MKKTKMLAIGLITSFSLISCSNNSNMMSDLNNTTDSVVRYVNGTFSAQINNTSINSVSNATQLALNNSGIYNIKNNNLNKDSAEITGTFKTQETWFSKSKDGSFKVQLIKGNNNTVNVYIKIGSLGDKQASVDLLANIRNNLGL